MSRRRCDRRETPARVMNPATRRRHLIWQSVLSVALTVCAIVYGAAFIRQPLRAADLGIAAQQLHSYAAEGVMLAEQTLFDEVYVHYTASEAQFLSDKVQDIADTLSTQRHAANVADHVAQALSAAHVVRKQ